MWLCRLCTAHGSLAAAEEAVPTQRKGCPAHKSVAGTRDSLTKPSSLTPKTSVGSLPSFLSGTGNGVGKGGCHIPGVPCSSPGVRSSLILHRNPLRYYQAEGEEQGQNSSGQPCHGPRAWPIRKARGRKGWSGAPRGLGVSDFTPESQPPQMPKLRIPHSEVSLPQPHD